MYRVFNYSQIALCIYILKKPLTSALFFASIFLATDMNTIYTFDDRKNERILDKDQFLLRSKHFLLLRQINMPLYRPTPKEK